MKVRMKAQITGLRNNIRWPAPGETVELPDEEGARMCSRGYAEPVVEERIETATPKADAEIRVARRPKVVPGKKRG